MHYVLSQPNGTLYWLARWGLLVFKSTLLGAAVLALVYTLTARFADYALRLSRNWEGLGFIIPLAQIGWIVWRGTNLYYKNEPSLFIIVAATALLVARAGSRCRVVRLSQTPAFAGAASTPLWFAAHAPANGRNHLGHPALQPKRNSDSTPAEHDVETAMERNGERSPHCPTAFALRGSLSCHCADSNRPAARRHVRHSLRFSQSTS